MAAPSSSAPLTGLCSLPAETLGSICEYLGQADLCRLALVCRRLSRIASGALFCRPVLHDVLSGDHFRFAFVMEPTRRAADLTDLTCTRWSDWRPWIDGLAPFPCLRSVSLANVVRGETPSWDHEDQPNPKTFIRLHEACRSMSRQPSLRRLHVARPGGPLGPALGEDTASVPQVTSLALTEIILGPDNPPFAGLASIFPNVTSLTLKTLDGRLVEAWVNLEAAWVSAGTAFNFVRDFKSLEAATIHGPLVGPAPDTLAFLVRQVRELSLDFTAFSFVANEDFYETVAPRDLFLEGPFPEIRSLYWGDFRNGDTIDQLISAVWTGRFPRVQRLKVMLAPRWHSDDDFYVTRTDTAYDRDRARRFVRALGSKGFAIHGCHRLIYAEMPSPSRRMELCRKGHREAAAREGEGWCECE